MDESKQPEPIDDDRGSNPASQIERRVSFPLITGGHPAPPGQELTAERIAKILLAEETANALRLAGFPVDEEALLNADD